MPFDIDLVYRNIRNHKSNKAARDKSKFLSHQIQEIGDERPTVQHTMPCWHPMKSKTNAVGCAGDARSSSVLERCK